MEDKAKFNTSGINDKFVANLIKVTISKENCYRMHEILREMQRLGAIDKMDSEMLLACCEML